MKQSLGIIEVVGLALAITVLDTMCKAAAVNLLEIERTNGGGWMVIKITGDVASVTAAIATGSALARQHNGLVAEKVIARPVNLVIKQPQVSIIALPAPATAQVAVKKVKTKRSAKKSVK